MVVPAGGVDKCRQPLSPGLLHDNVQRFGMVSCPDPSRHPSQKLRRMRLEAGSTKNTC
jgi:hypothetical protein